MLLFPRVALLLLLTATSATAQTIVDIVMNSTDHTTLFAAVGASPAVAMVLSSGGEYTVFAPTDAAFEEDEEYLNQLLTPEWSAHLTCLLTSHAIEGTILAADLPTTPTEVTTLSGYNVTVVLDGNEAYVDDIFVTTPDIMASNGVIHVVDDSPILPPCVTDSIVDIASSIDDFSTLVSLVDIAGLVGTLNGEGPFTVFAPTNEAFDSIPPGIVEALMDDPEALRSVLTYHVVQGNVYGDFMGTVTVETVQGGNLTASAMGESIVLNGDAASVTSADVLARNGVIHVIDSVLLPPDFIDPRQSNVEIVAASNDHTTLERAVTSVDGLVDVLNGAAPYTLFAPTDEAFEAINEDYLTLLLTPAWTNHLVCVLSEHVVPGASVLSGTITNVTMVQTLSGDMIGFQVFDQGITVEGITISGPDLVSRDGVVHSIDGVILPDCVTQSIYDVASVDSFSTLKSLIDRAGLNQTLQSTLGLTVFAPTNAAFDKVDQATLDFLASNATALIDVLNYHVVAGVQSIDDLLEEGNVETLQGSALSFAVTNDLPTVNGFGIDTAGVLASNGIVFVLEDVLIPLAEGETLMPVAAPTTVAPAVTAMPTDAPVMAMPTGVIAPPPTGAPVDAAPSSSATRSVLVALMSVFAAGLCL